MPGLEVLAHQLRLFGWPDEGLEEDADPRLSMLSSPSGQDAATARARLEEGRLVVALDPDEQFCQSFGASLQSMCGSPPEIVVAGAASSRSRPILRTLHRCTAFSHPHAEPIARLAGRDVWIWVPVGPRGMLLIGTDLSRDIVRYRQGDPNAAARRHLGPVWRADEVIVNERPNYLYQGQLDPAAPEARHADHWGRFFLDAIADRAEVTTAPLFPGSAPGAVVLTGDDDQAYLEMYAKQLELIGDTPITYFLHPLTRHTRNSLESMREGHRVDLGIHPDALDRPDRYGEVFRAQVEWYIELVGEKPLSLRNHGFLNDGYWGHLPYWREAGCAISSNLPGLNGQVLNGSLLPSRVVWDGELTDHWSLLTTFGDGMIFVGGESDSEAARRISSFGERVIASGLPAVLVFNLHPQNVDLTRAIHQAILDLIDAGFIAWTMRDCLGWFSARDRVVERSARTH